MTTTSVTTPADIASLLDGALSLREELQVGEWKAGSPAAVELTDASSHFAPAIERLIQSVDLWTLIATDDLAAVSVIVPSGKSVLSLFPLFRSALEHCAHVAWALDSTVDTRTRAARAALIALTSQDHLTGAACLIAGKGSSTHIEHRAEGERLRRAASNEFGVTVEQPYTIEGEVVPTFTDIIKHFGQRWGDERAWEGYYGYLCGTANHPSFNAYEYFDLSNLTKSPPIMSTETLIRLLQPVMVAYLKSHEATAWYMGLPDKPLNDYIDRVNRVIGPTLT